MIKEQGFIGVNYGGDDKLVMVHPTDITAAAAEELTTPATGKNGRYVASDEQTCNDIARVLGTAIGKPNLTWVTLTNGQMQESLETKAVPASVAAGLVDLYASIHSGALGEDYERHKPLMGNVKLNDFAQEFAVAFTR